MLRGVPWSTYVVLRDSVGSPGLRMTYLHGLLEIMSPSRQHEVTKKLIARLLELFGRWNDIWQRLEYCRLLYRVDRRPLQRR